MLVTTAGCDLDVERGPGWLFVRLRNDDADEPAFADFADRIWELLENHLTYRVVLEMDEVEVLPTTLIAELVQLHRRIDARNGVIRLAGLSPMARKTLDAWRLADRFAVYRDRVAAVMGTPRQPK